MTSDLSRNSITRCLIAIPLIAFAVPSGAADLLWDGTTGNIAAIGNGASTYTSGTWSTAIANWDLGAVAHSVWTNGDTAIFGGTYSAGMKLVTLGSSVTANQIRILTGDAASATSANRYDIGTTGEVTNAISFSGTYSTAFPTIDAGAANVRNTQFSAKITGTIDGGLVIAHGSSATNPNSGRILFGNAANDFVGDVTLLSGNTHAISNFGNAANKIIFAGGSLFGSVGSNLTYTIARDVVVSANSGINLNATGGTPQTPVFIIMDFQQSVTGAANLTRYSGPNVNGEVRFSGDMSGYTGTIENTGVGLMTIQSTATSAGAWKLSGGVLKLNTALDDAAIANGTGRSDLIMNGGTLDMNSRSEIINGLSGLTGTVQNQVVGTVSTLTLGDSNASASFGGVIRDNFTSGGTLAVTKIGSGTQTLGGANTYTGLTTVTEGTLAVSGSLTTSSLSIAGTLRGSGSIGGATILAGGTIAPGGDSGDRSLDFTGPVSGTGVIRLTIDSTSNYDSITGSGLFDASSLSLDVVMNDTGWIAATNASGLATATSYDIVSNPTIGGFENGTPLTLGEQVYWGVGADSQFFNFGGQDFLLSSGDFTLTAVTVPEPSAAALLLLATGLAAVRRRR